MSFSKRLLFLFTAVLLPAALAFAGAEYYLRHFSEAGYFTPATLAAKTYHTVPALFSRSILPPMRQKIELREQAVIEINSKGYRGPEFDTEKAPGTLRIIIYGGSSVFDIYASGDRDWPSQVQQLLQKNRDTPVEVINAGIPGHAAFDDFGRFFAEGHLFNPDYVLLYTGWNDLKFFSRKQTLLRQQTRRYSLEPLLYQYFSGWDKWWCEHSQIYVRLRYRFIMWKYRIGSEGVKVERHTDEINPAALRQYRLTLETFVDAARNAGAVPVLMLEAHLIGKTNQNREKSVIQYESQPLTHDALIEGYREIEKITREVAEDKEVSLIDASTPLSQKMQYFEDHVHTSKEGSKKLAEITANALEELLRLKPV